MYDQKLGRFLSEDPSPLPQSVIDSSPIAERWRQNVAEYGYNRDDVVRGLVNRYVYADNNPVNKVDPSGLQAATPPTVGRVGPSPLPVFWTKDDTGRVHWGGNVESHVAIPLALKNDPAAAKSVLLHEDVGWWAFQHMGDPDSHLGGIEFPTQMFSLLTEIASARQTGMGCRLNPQEHFPNQADVLGKMVFRAAREFYNGCCSNDSWYAGKTFYGFVDWRKKGLVLENQFFGWWKIECTKRCTIDGNWKILASRSVGPTSRANLWKHNPTWWPGNFAVPESIAITGEPKHPLPLKVVKYYMEDYVILQTGQVRVP